MKELIETIVKPLVDYPEAVSIETQETDRTITYKLSVHPDDMGKVIGKQGRVAKAIRTVSFAGESSQKKKTVIEIVDK
ncbi:KH domain-containing protein [Jeotgalibacillus haloalkalitolerans]|uniref:RNA-binding protein KhpA n=1 Tax=Jeotgalibacillus haloalkalitolerans TaxID=3104292 RepID=A0ABU5KKA3_9BACL|nr:KH domain-containing protein [Jeotgalibacillus sp. HH7-29]MDZ5711695.1 KH domain-containing protein [Jeotgalibacillus sp. HH7-29]